MKPIIHNITNYVTATDCANITLAVGASPIMADFTDEMEDIARICDALVINTGTINDMRFSAMLRAGQSANALNRPVVLDPVGAGVSAYRTGCVMRLLTELRFAVIRLNASELRSVCLNEKNSGGIDALFADENNSVEELASRLCEKTGAVVFVSGEKDIITDGKRLVSVGGGDKRLSKITGAGCMLSSVTGVFCTIMPPFEAAVFASKMFKECAAKVPPSGIGSFKAQFFDNIEAYVKDGFFNEKK